YSPRVTRRRAAALVALIAVAWAVLLLVDRGTQPIRAAVLYTLLVSELVVIVGEAVLVAELLESARKRWKGRAWKTLLWSGGSIVLCVLIVNALRAVIPESSP